MDVHAATPPLPPVPDPPSRLRLLGHCITDMLIGFAVVIPFAIPFLLPDAGLIANAREDR